MRSSTFALGDAAIAAWNSKYYYQFPRPVTVIRKVKAGSAVLWYPMGAQLSNSDEGKNITPPFPAYPSGHATFGGALFGILRQFVKEDHTFDFQSDEFNSKNKDAFNYIRCGEPGKNPDGSCGRPVRQVLQPAEVYPGLRRARER